MHLVLGILRALLGLFFLLSTVSKLFPPELFELKIIYDGYADWSNARYLSFGLITIEAVIAILLLVPLIARRSIYGIAATFMIGMSVLTVKQIMAGNTADCGCFGTWISFTPIQALIRNCIVLAAILYLLIKDKAKVRTFIPIASLLPFFVFSLLLIVFREDATHHAPSGVYTNSQASFAKEISFNTGRKDLSKGRYLILFLSAGCDHCKEMYMKLSIFSKKLAIPQSYLIVWGSEESLDELLSLVPDSFPYSSVDVDEFFAFREKGFPKVYLLENGMIRSEWNYNSFSFAEMARHFNSR